MCCCERPLNTQKQERKRERYNPKMCNIIYGSAVFDLQDENGRSKKKRKGICSYDGKVI